MTKARIFQTLFPSQGDSSGTIVNKWIIGLIILNTIAVILSSDDQFYSSLKWFFDLFEIVSVAIFSMEYILRLWCITENPKYAHPLFGRLKYFISFSALVDLLAILPFYVPFLTHLDLRFLRILRLIRILRIFKLGRYIAASDMIRNVVKDKMEELVLSFAMTTFLIIASSCVMYFIEHSAQPDQFTSIPRTMWWCVTTLTTVGYGDMIPITPAGRLLTGFISILGVGLFALPAGIMASGFSQEFEKRKINHLPNKCETCGRPF
ncbi:MAG TPA: ion transporter [Phnomibacter sp.]|nr:ion transporter [Phnomibacter sp.]